MKIWYSLVSMVFALLLLSGAVGLVYLGYVMKAAPTGWLGILVGAIILLGGSSAFAAAAAGYTPALKELCNKATSDPSRKDDK